MLKKIIIGLAVVLVGIHLVFVIWSGMLLPVDYTLDRNFYNQDMHKISEVQFNLIKAGIGAASSHNMQPWIIEVEDDKTFRLIADSSKDLPAVDSGNQQKMISQGTFINNVRKAAEAYDVDLVVELTDAGFHDLDPIVAVFTITNDDQAKLDTITSATYATGSSMVDLDSVIDDVMNESRFSYSLVEPETGRVEELKEYLRRGTKAEAENQAAIEEMLEVFQFTRYAMNEERYGLALESMPPYISMFVGPILDATTEWEAFGQSSIGVFEDRLAGEDTYLMIQTDNPDLAIGDYIALGEVMNELNVGLSGYSVVPAVQLLQDIIGNETNMEDFQNAFGDEEVVMILSITPRTEQGQPLMRHRVEDIVRYD